MATLAASLLSSYESAAQGDRDSIEALLAAYYPKIVRACSRRLKGQVAARQGGEDAAQLVLVRIFSDLVAGKWAGRPENEFSGWVALRCRTVCHKLVLESRYKIRDVRREQALEAGETRIDVPGRETDPAAIVAESEGPTGLVAELLSKVTREDDRAILEGIGRGESLAEIAVALGVEAKLVYWRVKYLRKLAARIAA